MLSNIGANMKFGKLEICTIVWVILALFSIVRPDPLAQGINGAQPIWYSIQKIMMFAPYLALSVLMLNLKFKWIKESWFVNSLPFVLIIVAGLELYNCLVANINGIGSWLTTGLAYLVVLNVAHNKKPYSDGLMYGVIAAFGAMFIWEAIYQIIVHTKSNWAIGDNLTFFYSAIVCIPFIICLFMGKIRIGKATLLFAGLFLISFIVWDVTGFWTHLFYADSQWQIEPYNYWSYLLTRLNKIALCGLLVSLFYLPFVKECKNG